MGGAVAGVQVKMVDGAAVAGGAGVQKQGIKD